MVSSSTMPSMCIADGPCVLSPTEAWRHRDELAFIDLRDPVQWADGHVPGSHNVPMCDLSAAAVHDAAGAGRVTLVCRNGLESTRAATMLRELGEPHVARIAGGVAAWRLLGLPLRACDAGTGAVRDELLAAMDDGGLRLEYGVVESLRDGRTAARWARPAWQHPRRGRLAAAGLESLAVRAGLDTRVAAWTLSQALQELSLEPVTPVQVDVTHRALGALDWGARLRKRLSWFGVSGASLMLRITLAELLEDPDRAVPALALVRETGARVAVVGVTGGPDELRALAGLQIDAVELDRAAVRQVLVLPRSFAAIRATLALAAERGWTTAAAGVVTEAHASVLQRMGCDWVHRPADAVV